jgi:hypothetical protein
VSMEVARGRLTHEMTGRRPRPVCLDADLSPAARRCVGLDVT